MVDTKRVAVGGHSYGAFMAANLLAHAGVSPVLPDLTSAAVLNACPLLAPLSAQLQAACACLSFS